MKKIILLAIGIVLMASVSWSAPFLVCDPQDGVTDYKLTGPSWVPMAVTAQPDGSIKMDVSGATVGSNSLTVAACITDPLWGQLCSSFVPFEFIRPSAAAVPKNIWLIK